MNLRIHLTSDALSVEHAISFVADPSYGAITTFIGSPRDTYENIAVYRLEYEAYTAMAELTMKTIAEEAIGKYGLGKVSIAHRLGQVGISEYSIVIACSGVHRAGALQALSYIIEKIKFEVPIWKKEIREDGEYWKSNK